MKFLTKEEYEVLKKTELHDLGKANCPFCNQEVNNERIIWRGESFYVMHALCSYAWVKNHVMAIPYKHSKYTHEMTKEEFSGLKEVEEFIKNFYGEEEHFSFIRETMWARSLEHLHYHFLPWVIKESQMSDVLRSQWYPKN